MRRWWLGVGLTACGDPIAGSDYLGDPMLSISGEVLADAPLLDQAARARVAILWNGGRDTELRMADDVTTVTDFPARYQMDVLAPPPPEVVHVLPGSGDQLGTIGIVALYDDVNGDDRIQPEDEPLLGVGQDIAIIWFKSVGPAIEPPPGGRPTPDPKVGFDVVSQDCARPGSNPPLPVDRDSVNLIVGDVCEYLINPDCDPNSTEWGPICGP